ncbi:hypothetical protein [Neomoorella glycerini]|uniref:hypothetical protein n=1 Tax=Neomoorella glycerini TaxID=55779 RepID=UPI0012E14CE0|nr:hypothetical protein [Moorella glycerini]
MSFWRGFIAGSIMGAIIGSILNWPRETPLWQQEPVPPALPEEQFPARSRGVVRRRPQVRP